MTTYLLSSPKVYDKRTVNSVHSKATTKEAVDQM